MALYIIRPAYIKKLYRDFIFIKAALLESINIYIVFNVYLNKSKVKKKKSYFKKKMKSQIITEV